MKKNNLFQLAVACCLCGVSLTFALGAPSAVPAAAPAPAATSNPLLGNPFIVLFATIGLGLLIGQIKIWGLSLGSSAVIFTSLLIGALGGKIPSSIGTLGLILFVYCVGISAGPRFFRSFRSQGRELVKLGFVLVGLGALTTVAVAWVGGIPKDLAVGMFAGALTSTPALAAAMDNLPAGSNVTIGYGLAYPFGVIGVVLFVQLLPRLLKLNLAEIAQQDTGNIADQNPVRRALVEVTNPALAGKQLEQISLLADLGCQVPRILSEERLVPVDSETTLQLGQILLVVGHEKSINSAIDFLGRESHRKVYMDTETERMKIVTTSPQVVGRSLRELRVLSRFGVTVTRIIRNDVTFVPTANTVIQEADILISVGHPELIAKFAQFAGHRQRALDETDLISMALGITLGVVVGMIPIGLPGSSSFTLGTTGGPMLVALLLAHMGGWGKFRGRIPRPSRLLLGEIGLVFFLAGAGIQAGERILDVVRDQGLGLLFYGALVTLVPMIGGFIYGKYRLKLGILQILGGTCGGMTSTPGLGALTSSIDSEVPVVSYATAYPVALIFMTICAKIILAVLS